MPDIHKRQSLLTFDDIDNHIKPNKLWAKLSESQKISRISYANLSIYKLKRSLGYKDFFFDSSTDADLVLSPTKSSFENIFLAYIKIKFGAYDGEDIVINDVDATKVLLSIDEGNIIINDSHPEIVTYTIPITGATLNPTFKVTPPYPSMVDVVYSGNNIVVTANKNHVAFDIEIEKRKESI